MRSAFKKNIASHQNILYELMLYTEWNQESDILRSSFKNNEKNASSNYRIWKPWDYFRKCESLLDEIANLQNSLLGWHIAVGEVETVIAILQDTLLEIRTHRDDFSSVVGKAAVAKDSAPQWRRMCWSPDCSVLAIASSSGAVNFYDLLGSLLSSIPSLGNSKESQAWPPEHSLAGMFFIPARAKNHKWPYELILVDYSGSLRSYHVSPLEGCLDFHHHSFSKTGVSSVCWDATHNLLIVSSPPQHSHMDLKKEPMGWGVNAWRLLNDHPYYRMAVPSAEDVAKVEAKKGISFWFPSFSSSTSYSVVFKMALSPTARYLACVHTCGTISVWQLPSLRLHGVWSLREQPNFDVQPDVAGLKRRSRGNQLDEFLPIDISWWAEEKVIIARRNGAVSVCELCELRNLLGETPEFVQGEPRLSPICTQKGVLVLECETNQKQDGNNSSEEEESLVNRSTALVQSTVYLITDIERFQPKRKKPRVQKRTFRLLGIKSTTPEELFSRKIDAGEFEEALHLAEVYDLDSDRVYQSQWRNSPVSEQTIIAYLSKIKKKRWVFEECHERVPDTLSAAKKLIEFGLKITSLQALAELASEGEYEIINGENNKPNLVLNGRDFMTIPVEEFTEDQKCLTLTRRTLLIFSDRLFTYEKMINSSESAYDREAYDRFRRQPVPQSAIELARQSDQKAVALILTYQGQEALPYWLNILSNFPETTSPDSYKNLLPECSFEGDIFPWEEARIRDEDWSESTHFDALGVKDDYLEYSESLPTEPRAGAPTLAEVEEWYRLRIYELEQRCAMVDQPLELSRLARQRNVKGLDSLYNELVTLDVLVYDVGMEDISLRDLEIMTPLQKAQALMNQSNENNFVENLRHRLVPFLQRCEKLQALSRRDLLSQFVMDISSMDLYCPLKMFEWFSSESCETLISSNEELVSLALDSVYAYPNTDRFRTAEAILDTVNTSYLGSSVTNVFEKVKTARNELEVAVILRDRGHPLSLSYIHNHRENLDVARTLFLDLSTSVMDRVPKAGETEWAHLLQDFLKIQELVFNCMPVEMCYEVHTAGVLASESSAVIRTAVHSLCCHSEECSRKPLTLQRSVQLVLQAAVHYCDSAASLTDPNINLAKACLNLITEDNAEVQEEKDLITAFQLLHEFKIKLLPMQVRLCTERMRLVESCLAARPTAYKDYHKLLSLAHKLRICGGDSRRREGTILVRVADIAFQAQDYPQCAEVCDQLISRRHAMGWEAAQRLGQCGEYHNFSIRQRLIAFALVHCPDDKAQDYPQCAEVCDQLISRRHAMGWEAAQRLGQCGEYHNFSIRQRLIAFALVHCPDDKVPELLDTRCELEHKRLQSLIQEHTTIAETPSEDEEFIDAATSPQSPTKDFLPQLSSTIQNTSKLLNQLTNSGFWKEKFIINKDVTINKKQKKENQMTEQGFPSFYWTLHGRCHESVLSADYSGESVEWRQYQLIQALLQATLLEQEKLPPQLSKDNDKVLVQFASLVMPEDCCVGLATLLSLTRPEASDQCFSTLPLTLHTLQLAVYLTALLVTLQHQQNAFLWTPDQVLAWATSQSDTMSEGSKQLKKALTQLMHFEQSKQVQQLDSGVDVRRFAWDAEYKTDSILGLAMCEEWGRLQAALSLGSTHGVPGWQIVFSHVRVLLLNNSPQLTQRLGDNRLMQLLRDEADTIVNKFQENVLPILSGVSYNQLISYYSLLNTVAPDTAVNSLLPRDHIKLIKKVKATSPDIDYIRLVTSPNAVLEVLKPALRKDSVGIVAKLLKELLKALPVLQGNISVSSLYCEWAVMQFKLECINPTCRNPQEQFEALQMYFPKMNGQDILIFVKRTIFCHQSVVKLSTDTRVSMIDSVIHYCRKQPNLNNSPDILKIQELEKYLLSVWSLDQFTASCKTLRNYIVRLDEACGDPEALSTIIQTALVDAAVPSHVLQKIAQLSNKKNLSSYVTDLLQSLPVNPSLIATVLQRVEDCLSQGEKGESWSILIGPFTERTELPVSVRRLAAQLSQRLGANYMEELEALRLRTEAVLRSPVTLSQVTDHNSRYLLFKQLLSQAHSWDSLHTLSLLLSTWPHVDTSWYLELIESMAQFPIDAVFATLQKIFRKNVFEEEEVTHLVSRIDDSNDTFIISVCIIPEFERLHQKAINLLRKLPSGTNLPKDLIKRIVEAGLIVELVGSPILMELRNVLLESCQELTEQAFNQLKAANHLPEAELFTLNPSDML